MIFQPPSSNNVKKVTLKMIFTECNRNISNTAQKMKFFIKDFFSKCGQIRKKLRIWSHLLKKFLMENSSFCAV